MNEELLEMSIGAWESRINSVGTAIINAEDVKLIKTVIKSLQEENLRLETELSMSR